jgi:transposase
MTTIAHTQPARLTVGVDTHKDVHVACAKDQLGRRLAITLVPTTTAGYAELLSWAGALGQVEAFGVEGAGCYGAELVRFLHAHGQRDQRAAMGWRIWLAARAGAGQDF